MTTRRCSSSIGILMIIVTHADPILEMGLSFLSERTQLLREGSDITLVTWGAMCERCEVAVEETDISADAIDLRTIMPWDKTAILASVKKTNKCLIVHEDVLTAGFGAEIAAVLASEAFHDLDAPVERIAMPDIPLPHNVALMESVVPSVEKIGNKMR